MSGVSDDELRSVTIGELKPFATKVIVVDYDSEWPRAFAEEEACVRGALGDGALMVEHTGSTSVPGLPAKPIIDVLLVVADSGDESAYVPALEAAGYTLRIREPNWFEHRMFHRRVEYGDDRDVNLHVFPSGVEEIDRILTFRDHLRANDSDREEYAAVKRDLATREWKFVQNYADAKTPVIEEILRRAKAD
ncbi:GrpB-like predicted nucleotidyltransferase (UPF0157 family) [Herbihabitans rhizosphaerae]|uniref:GrpB-like predicted nucleotidyltransferase (UPF0157 family) n=1 Tax=Herbihabitans rhizosphaerae TaxID=1872711 RepID=A0A4Q7L4N2_9PSEU|nr:GrpB family protein [Herbihabitans rhizosphaerae]RZS43172.1 GrpB-like predicted nucleotidyltransferase (UPF0157 family) [Herbihabitans rhizosphaerae]